MNDNLVSLPLQRVSTKEKLKIRKGEKFPHWVVKSAEFYINRISSFAWQKNEMTNLYKAAEGTIDATEYSYVLNPFHSQNEKLLQYPARLRNYDIISPLIELFMGERSRKAVTAQVIVTNADAKIKKFKELGDEVETILQKEFVNALNAEGIQTNMQDQETPEIKEFSREFLNGWQDKRAIDGQYALDFIAQNCLVKDKRQRMFYDYLISGMAASYKDVNHDDVLYETIHPLQIYPMFWGETPFIEDCGAVVVHRRMSAQVIIDRWREKLTPEDIDWITQLEANNMKAHRADRARSFTFTDSTGTQWVETEDGFIDVVHVVWKTLKKVGILQYVDDFGIPREMEVDEDYKLDRTSGDLDIEWMYVNSWFGTWKIGEGFESNSRQYGSDDNRTDLGNSNRWPMYLEYGFGKVQRGDLNNNSVCKLPYNGFFMGHRSNSVVSIFKKGLPYQSLYNIMHYRFELSLAKNMDKVMLFPIGLIPKGKGWNTENWMHKIRSMSIAFFNEKADKALAALQAIKELDLSLARYMGEMWNLMFQIKKEWWESVGVNEQRLGQVAASQGKGAQERAIFNSALISEEMYRQFSRFEETEGNGLIDVSKIAWVDGKNAQFRNSDNRVVDLAINGTEHADTNYAVFTTQGTEEAEKKQTLMTLLQPLAQNGVGFDLLVEAIDSNNFAKVKNLIQKGVAIQKEREDEQAKAQQQQAEQVAQSNIQVEQMKDKRERDLAQLKADTEIEKALILSDSFNAGTDKDADGTDDSLEIVERHDDRMLKRRQQDANEEKMKADSDLKREELDIKRRDSENKLKIARENRNRFDK